MKAVFADTFYWIALSDPSDTRYRDALAVESTLVGAKIVTTEEVLSEFLTFFAADPRWRARQPGSARFIPGPRRSYRSAKP